LPIDRDKQTNNDDYISSLAEVIKTRDAGWLVEIYQPFK